MKNCIIYLGILLVSLATNAFASYDSYNNNRTYKLDKYKTSVRHNDYKQETYDKTGSIRPYVGVDLFYTEFDFSKNHGYLSERPGSYFNDSAFGIGGIAGFRFYKYLGLEGFYRRTFREHKISNWVDSGNDDSSSGTITTEGTTLLRSYGLDLLAYLPINKQIDFLASIGIGQYKIETTLKNQITMANVYDNYVDNKSFEKSAMRIGAGLQYNLKEALYMRGMLHYIKLPDDSYLKNLIEVSLGMYYMF